MQPDQTQDNVQDQNLLNDEISQQLNDLQSSAGAVGPAPVPEPAPADPASGMPGDSYQRQDIDSPVASPGAVVNPQPYEPPTEIEEPALTAQTTDAVQDMVTPDEPAEPAQPVSADVPTEEEVIEEEEEEVQDLVQPADEVEDAVEAAVATVESEEPEEEAEPVAPIATPSSEDTEESEEETTEEPEEEESEETTTTVTPSLGDAEEGDLEEVKRKALEELSPMVDKLELAPEKRYDVIMEMIQATDNAELVPQAYEAAHAIEDENLKAQALLEIINEVDYLTKDDAKE